MDFWNGRLSKGRRMDGLRREKGRSKQSETEQPASTFRQTHVRGRVLFGIGLMQRRAEGEAPSHAQISALHGFALTLDHGLVAAGIAAAIGSAGFAGFMIARDNSHPMFGGIEHLMIFAQPIGGQASHRSPQMDQSESHKVDFNVTGSIDQAALNASAERPRPDKEPDVKHGAVKGYVLRFAPKGGLLAEGPKGSYVAMPGTVLPDAGRILSIENRSGRWLITTEKG